MTCAYNYSRRKYWPPSNSPLVPVRFVRSGHYRTVNPRCGDVSILEMNGIGIFDQEAGMPIFRLGGTFFRHLIEGKIGLNRIKGRVGGHRHRILRGILWRSVFGRILHLPFFRVLKAQISGSEKSPKRLMTSEFHKKSMTVFAQMCNFTQNT